MEHESLAAHPVKSPGHRLPLLFHHLPISAPGADDHPRLLLSLPRRRVHRKVCFPRLLPRNPDGDYLFRLLLSFLHIPFQSFHPFFSLSRPPFSLKLPFLFLKAALPFP